MTDTTELVKRLEAGRQIGEVWCEAWMFGECVEIDCASELDAYEWAMRSKRSGASAWAICRQTMIGRKPLETWVRGETWFRVRVRQALEGRISHRAAGLPQGIYVQPHLIAALLKAEG